MISVIEISPELNTDFECPYARLEFFHKGKQDFATQRRWSQILYFCMIIAARLVSVGVIWRFMSHIVEKKTEIYKKLFFLKLHENLRKRSCLKMERFFLRSVYIRQTAGLDINPTTIESYTVLLNCAMAGPVSYSMTVLIYTFP